MLPGCSGEPFQSLFEVNRRALSLIAHQLQVVGYRIDDLQATAVLRYRGHRILGEGKPVWLFPVGPEAVPGAYRLFANLVSLGK